FLYPLLRTPPLVRPQLVPRRLSSGALRSVFRALQWRPWQHPDPGRHLPRGSFLCVHGLPRRARALETLASLPDGVLPRRSRWRGIRWNLCGLDSAAPVQRFLGIPAWFVLRGGSALAEPFACPQNRTFTTPPTRSPHCSCPC